jgi:sulfoacetaldehyde dehydrogenase
MVNQVQVFGGGSFSNKGFPFTLAMGWGSREGRSTTRNMNSRHSAVIYRLARQITERRPTDQQLFGSYLENMGSKRISQ